LREPHAVARENVEVRRFDFRLSVAAKFGVPEVIGEDDNYIWHTRLLASVAEIRRKLPKECQVAKNKCSECVSQRAPHVVN